MNLYMTTRWGNPYDEFGPDGEDTNMLIVAETVSKAAEIADDMFGSIQWKSDHDAPDVATFTQNVTLLGVADADEPCILHGPWVAFAIVRNSKSWQRQSKTEDWDMVKA